MQTATTTRGRG